MGADEIEKRYLFFYFQFTPLLTGTYKPEFCKELNYSGPHRGSTHLAGCAESIVYGSQLKISQGRNKIKRCVHLVPTYRDIILK